MTVRVHRALRTAALAALAGAAAAAAGWCLVALGPEPASALVAPPPAPRGLAEVRAEGVLRVALVQDEVGLDVRRGREEGLARELAAEVAEGMGLALEVVRVASPSQGIRLVTRGAADLFATADPGPAPVLDTVAWSRPIAASAPVLVGREASGIRSLQDLRGLTVAVRRHSRMDRLARSWARELGGALRVERLPATFTDRRLAHGAARQEWPLALLGENRARLEAEVYSPLELSAPLADPLPVRWAMRPNAPRLADEIDARLETARREGLLAELERRYLESPERLKARRRPVFRERGPRLSPWDGLFRSAAHRHGFDWRLLAALSFAESGYDPWEVSPVGAVGLFQLMPRTADAFGADDPFDPAQNVAAGASHLRWLYDLYEGLDETDRLAFALAAYNIGMGHVRDARVLAEERGLDPDRFEGHVEITLRLLEDPAIADDLPHGRARGGVTARYVRHVLGLYEGFAGTAVAAAVLPRPAPTGS